jgi:hypothetical protein
MQDRILKRQPRSKSMSPAIKQLIAISATSNDKNREELAQELLTDIKNKYPKEIPPVIDTIVKLISKYRNHGRAPLDRPWNLGELDNLTVLNSYNINAEAIDYILKVQQYAYNERIPLQISVRQAKWISRLYRIIIKKIPFLWFVSYIYTNYEVICEIADVPFNTRKLDACLHDPKGFIKVAELVNKTEYSNEAFKKAYYYNINRYNSEIEEVIK